jgi:hypothetical protein
VSRKFDPSNYILKSDIRNSNSNGGRFEKQVKMTSKHEIEVSKSTKAIRVFATKSSNDLEVLDDLPYDFENKSEPID